MAALRSVRRRRISRRADDGVRRRRRGRADRSLQPDLRARPCRRAGDPDAAAACARAARLPDPRLRGRRRRRGGRRSARRDHRRGRGQRGALFSVGAGARSAATKCASRVAAVRLRRRHLRAQRGRARGVESACRDRWLRSPARPDLARPVSEADIARLNALGINCLRASPAGGDRRLGRAHASARAADPEWRYIAVRRTALLIEQSLLRGTQWAAFEPNDAQLWQRLRRRRRDLHAGPVRAGRVSGQHAEPGLFRQMRREHHHAGRHRSVAWSTLSSASPRSSLRSSS